VTGIDPAVLSRLQAALISTAGGYLRNPVRQAFSTCSVCTTPAPGFMRCFRCKQDAEAGLPTADLVAPMTYAVKNMQTGWVMHGYKAPHPLAEHRLVVQLLALCGVAAHTACAAKLIGSDVTHWSTVPSLPAKPGGQHPLRTLVASAAVGTEVTLTAAPTCQDSRAFNLAHFSAAPLPPGAHVLLIEDTWAGGGHTQSAAAALKQAGAQRVSAIVVARWLRLDYGNNLTWAKSTLTSDYDVDVCPFTGAACP